MNARVGRRSIAVVLAVLLGVTACGSPGGGWSDPKPTLVPLAAVRAADARLGVVRWKSILDSHRKAFGLSVDGAPLSLAPLQTVARSVGKSPDLVEYYQDWADPFVPRAAQQACDAGMLPVLTWESWDWNDLRDGATAPSQLAYAPREIAAGRYDNYIRATAQAIKSIHCTLVLRVDQEANGYWYPWGLGTPGMHNTAAEYVAMWRHIWRVFHAEGVTNVRWCWSPNLILSHGPQYSVASLYPGDRYVDVVGFDAYLLHPTDTPRSVLGPIMATLRSFASNRPWFVAETGVASGPTQPAQIASLLRAVAHRPRLHGLVYLDTAKPRADWSFDASPSSVAAFRQGISDPAYGRAASTS